MMDIIGLINSIVTFSIVPLFLTTRDAHFYIDAGTATLILQFLIAGFIGGLFLIKVFWKKVKGFFGNLFARVRKGTK